LLYFSLGSFFGEKIEIITKLTTKYGLILGLGVGIITIVVFRLKYIKGQSRILSENRNGKYGK